MSWYVKLDEHTIQVEDVSIVKRVNEIPTFEFICGSEWRDALQVPLTKVVLCHKEQPFLEGYVTSVEDREDKIRVRGFHKLIELNWVYVKKDNSYRVQYDNVPVNEIASELLVDTSYTLSECPTDIISIRFEYATKWTALKKLAEITGTYIVVKDSQISLVSELPSLDVDLTDYQEKPAEDNIPVKRVIALGSGDGINQVETVVEDESVTAGREVAVSFRDIDNVETLRILAQRYLAHLNAKMRAAKAKALIDYFPFLEPGYKVKDKVIHSVKVGPLDEVHMELGAAEESFVHKDKQLEEATTIEQTVEQGATNIYCVNEADNADSSHPMSLNFYIPPEAVAINRVKLNMTIEPFRAYSKGAMAGGGTTVTSSSGGGTVITTSSGGGVVTTTDDAPGPIGLSWCYHRIGSEMHSHAVDLGSHSHNVDISTDTAGSHKHKIMDWSTDLSSDYGNIWSKYYLLNSSGELFFVYLRSRDDQDNGPVDAYSWSSGSHSHDVSGSTDTVSLSGDSGIVQSDSYSGYVGIRAKAPAPEPSGTPIGYYILIYFANRSYADRVYNYEVINVTKGTTIDSGSWSVDYGEYASKTIYTTEVDAGDVIEYRVQDSSGNWHVWDKMMMQIMAVTEHDHDVEIPDHTHEVNIPNHTHEVTIPNHQHDLEFGIYEEWNDVDVTINVNGTDVATVSESIQDLEITDYITQGWNTVTLTPTNRCRLNTHIYIQIFIRSR